ncbi:MAG: protocatechuate 3,4-dioxygenase subunit alpha [Ferruginibacter sp.]
MEKLPTTPSQTIGPFFAYSLTAEQYGYNFDSIVNDQLISEETTGEKIYITGKVFDGAGKIINDAMIELWQADADGNYRAKTINKNNNGFTGFGRLGTGTQTDQSFNFYTIKPAGINGQAPHINIILFMRGSLHRLTTRLYFNDEKNDTDPLLNAIEPERRKTLIANKTISNEKTVYQFNIYMQGENETVFFQL